MIVSRSGKIVDVSGYDPSTTSRKLQVVTAAVAYDRPTSGETIILIIHQAIHVPDMDHHLLSTMQSRTNDVIINDRPKFLTTIPTDNDHCILAPSEDPGATTRLPLRLHGTVSYLNVPPPPNMPSVSTLPSRPTPPTGILVPLSTNSPKTPWSTMLAAYWREGTWKIDTSFLPSPPGIHASSPRQCPKSTPFFMTLTQD
jgi:hypothetical protein